MTEPRAEGDTDDHAVDAADLPRDSDVFTDPSESGLWSKNGPGFLYKLLFGSE